MPNTDLISKKKIHEFIKNNKITINFITYDEHETIITSFQDIPFNPFKKGDTIFPIVDNIKRPHSKTITDANDILKSKYNEKPFTLIKEIKYVSFNILGESTITINYYCDLTKE